MFCEVFRNFAFSDLVQFLMKNVFSKSMLARQGCALANLRLVFFADDFLEFEASGWDADFLDIKEAIFRG